MERVRDGVGRMVLTETQVFPHINEFPAIIWEAK